MVKGTVEDAAMNSFVVKVDGKSITFPISGETDLSNLSEGLKIGDQVSVIYTGNIENDTDGSNTTVVRVNPVKN